MSDRALTLTRSTALILAEVRHREQRAVDRRSARIGSLRLRPFEAKVEPLSPIAVQVDPDPAHMQRLKVTEEIRSLERPGELDEQVRMVTPQFILRDTARLDMYGDTESLQLRITVLRDLEVRDYLDDARRCHFERREWLTDLSHVQVRLLVAEKRALMVETPWHSIFGRREPDSAVTASSLPPTK